MTDEEFFAAMARLREHARSRRQQSLTAADVEQLKELDWLFERFDIPLLRREEQPPAALHWRAGRTRRRRQLASVDERPAKPGRRPSHARARPGRRHGPGHRQSGVSRRAAALSRASQQNLTRARVKSANIVKIPKIQKIRTRFLHG